MKYVYIPAIVISIVFAVIFGMYAFAGFATWILSDPFHWITYPTPYESPYKADIDKCRASGGYPDVSGWNGSLKECKKLP